MDLHRCATVAAEPRNFGGNLSRLSIGGEQLPIWFALLSSSHRGVWCAVWSSVMAGYVCICGAIALTGEEEEWMSVQCETNDRD
jgi:hypothetical protein